VDGDRRLQFLVPDDKIPERSRIYADHNATTPLHPRALEAMLPWLSGPGNPSSVHAEGRAARRAVEDAREAVARALGAEPGEISFTAGGTEADALAVIGGALAARDRDPARTAVAFTAAEHAAVRESALSLTAQGFTARELTVDRDGLPTAPSPGEARDLALVSAVLANNETGVLNAALPVLAASARAAGALVHTDAVQAVGKVPVSVRELGVDLLSLSAHKLCGPKGTGALFVRKGTELRPLIPGGGQEKGRRSGTEGVAGIAGLAAALVAAVEALESERARLGALRDAFETGLSARLGGVAFNGKAAAGTSRLPGVSSVRFEGTDASTLMMSLDLEGVAVSSGSACSTGTPKPSRILLACGLTPDEARSTIRFSFGRTTTEEDVQRLHEVVPRVVSRVRGRA
jgi:cysteine desulfurase